MYVWIHSDKQENNRGSSKDLVNYLEKENLEKEDVLSKQMFFNQGDECISAMSVQNAIDANTAKLCKNEAKFYMITVNPSQVEQKHICRAITGREIDTISKLTPKELKRFEEALKEYSRVVMNEYAKNFNRGLNADNILYFGKVEHNRYYGRDSQEVRDGIKRCGDLKEGLQTHVHIIVSRKDMTNKIKLSPMAKARNAKNIVNGKQAQIGFDRMSFVSKCEKKFDSFFEYKRSQYLKFDHFYAMKNQMGMIAKSFTLNAANIPMIREANQVSKVISSLSSINKDPINALSSTFKQVPIAKECLKAISYVYNPSKIVLDLGRMVVSQTIKGTSI